MQISEAADGVEQTPDDGDRIRDFWKRHGGPAVRPSQSRDAADHSSGWTEVYAADGYTLRCDWSRIGSRQEMNFTEVPP
jgi:hypothetical protein